MKHTKPNTKAVLFNLALVAASFVTGCTRNPASTMSPVKAEMGIPVPATQVAKNEAVPSPSSAPVELKDGPLVEMNFSEGSTKKVRHARRVTSPRVVTPAPIEVAEAPLAAPSNSRVTEDGGYSSSSKGNGTYVFVEGGFNFGWAATNPPIATCCRDGVVTTIGAEVELDETFSVIPGVRYAQKGGYGVIGGSAVNVNFDYVEVPLLFKARMDTRKVRPFIVAGPNVGINVGAQAESRGTVTSLKSQVKNIDLSVDAGIGVDLDFNDNFGGYLLNRYSIGVVDVDTSADSWKNRSMQVIFGLRYRLK